MLRLLVLMPTLAASTVAALFAVTGGANFVIAAIVVAEYQRRQGYKGNEGRLSEREGGAYYATKFDKNSDHDLSVSLGRLALRFPAPFGPFMNKKYDFTKSEGELLRSMVHPAVKGLEPYEALLEELEQDPGNEEIIEALVQVADGLSKLIAPIIVFLKQFPSKRVKSV